MKKVLILLTLIVVVALLFVGCKKEAETGEVEVLSATTFVDEKDGQPFYKAVIKLDSDTIGEGSKRRHILPGMVVEADIVTDSKSLVKYLLAPVYRSLDKAFSER